MADYYCRASFSVLVTADEADVMQEVFALGLDGLTASELENLYQHQSRPFRETFPRIGDDPFASFRALFNDPEDLDPGATMMQEHAADSRVTLAFFGDNVDVEAIANIVHAVCRSAQPFGFCYSYGCTKLRAGEFGGGHAIISNAGVVIHDSDTALHRGLAALEDEDARSLVIAKRTPEHGLDFWNNQHGFGRLADATVFSPKEAARFDLPIADNEPEWLTMPPRFA